MSSFAAVIIRSIAASVQRSVCSATLRKNALLKILTPAPSMMFPSCLKNAAFAASCSKSLRLNSAIPTLRIGVQWLNPPSSPPRNAQLLSSANTLSCTMLIFPLPKHWNTAALQTMQESTLSGSRQKSLSTMIRTQSLRMWTAFLFPAASANAVLKA